jgi:Asp-tRNA(Asn)/Glu-tRNA(Gln) amidotransferase A subunit family amidase
MNPLSATEAAAAIRSGALTSVQLVKDCLARIDEVESTIQAWAFLDSEYALQQAREADRRLRSGGSLGLLHGVPVGVKDIFDTYDMPTENGTVLHAGRTPTEDAAAVALLRAAGAVIMGKTVTTELAVYSPGKTRNPHNPKHSPGGSSSGSAAAVASSMVPLAIGSQTNGSVIRPAAYCGVYGYKPSRGLIPLRGALAQSRPLDTAGVFARNVEDAALLAEQLIASDWHDPHARPRAHPDLTSVAKQEPPTPPRLAFVRTNVWASADPECKEAFVRLLQRLGSYAEEVVLPDWFGQAIDWHRTIMEADLAKSFASEYDRGRDRISARLREMIERGQQCRAIDYNRALDRVGDLEAHLQRVFADYDAVVTPATLGTAPRGLESTGSPAFCTLWTLTGVPAMTLPLLKGADGLPLGVQVIGAKGDDARLLRTARWLAGLIGGKAETVRPG